MSTTGLLGEKITSTSMAGMLWSALVHEPSCNAEVLLWIHAHSVTHTHPIQVVA
jgi:hypothetical protein